MSKITLRCIVICLASLFASAPNPLVAEEGRGELGVQLGLLLPDESLSAQHRNIGDAELVYGLRGGYQFSARWAWFADVYRAEISTARQSGSAATWALRTGLEAYLSPEDRRSRWFVAGGPGRLDVDLDGGAGFDRIFASLGIGQRWSSRDDDALRWELRADRTLSSDGIEGDAITRGLFVVSYVWGLGAATDSDGDGVRDKRDNCPDTPRAAVVDDRGCPIDSDGDGVSDGIDECPSTAEGRSVDARGCPIDSDGDGVFDDEDRCPSTPKRASVDDRGCPKDSDVDGVFDGMDDCADTPKGAQVDAAGCPKDGDRDGVFDGLDECPQTASGRSVDARGCPPDSDGDGVPDDKDECPKTPAGVAVKKNGCEKASALFQDEKKSLVLDGVRFKTDSAELDDASRLILDGVALSLVDWPEVRIEIGGHTDADGAESYNQRLSARRAESVRDYLVSKGIAAERMTTRGYGESRPIEDGHSQKAKAKNRRVELKRID